MRIVIVGADPVGEHLLGLAVEGKHDVVLIEADEARAEHCAQTYDALVLHSNIGEQDVLEEAGASHAQALIATTTDDSVNLMTMVMGQEYEIENLTSTVNSRHRKPLFDRLGVNTLVDPEVLAARHLLNLTLNPGGEAVTSLAGRGQIYELTLGRGSPLQDRSVAHLYENEALPADTGLVLIERDDRRLFPREDLELKAGDGVLLYSANPLTQDDLALFTAAYE